MYSVGFVCDQRRLQEAATAVEVKEVEEAMYHNHHQQQQPPLEARWSEKVHLGQAPAGPSEEDFAEAPEKLMHDLVTLYYTTLLLYTVKKRMHRRSRS